MRAVALLLLSLVCGGWIHGTATSPYLGQVATRTTINQGTYVSGVPVMAVSAHYLPHGVSDLTLVFQNFWVDSNNIERPAGSDPNAPYPSTGDTITASVEFPPGTCTQIKFSGSGNGAFNGPLLRADKLTISIPDNSWIKIRQYRTSATLGVPINGFGPYDPSLGDALDQSMGATDQTLTCDAVSSFDIPHTLSPIAILSNTTQPSLLLIGDSIDAGWNGSLNVANSVGDAGVLAPSIGPTFGYANFGVGGTQAFTYTTNSTIRQSLYQYFSHFVVEFGINDLIGGRSLATLKTSLSTIYSGFGGKPAFQTTLTPDTTSTDSWATVANQSVTSIEGDRTSFNDSLRAATFGPSNGYFDIESVVRAMNGSDIVWKAGAGFPQCSPWTPDGIHLTLCGYEFIPGTNVIDTTRIHYP